MSDTQYLISPAVKEQTIAEAVAMKSSGKYNCAQAVACAYASLIGTDREQIYNTANAFGRGMGCMEATCGALTGAGIILGIATGDRVKAMQMMAAILKRFEQRNGATICKALKGVTINPQTGKITPSCPLRACDLCVADAAEFLADALNETCVGS